MTPNEIHNKLAGMIVQVMVKPMLENGGDTSDVLVLAESVLAGVALCVIKCGGDEKALDVICAGAKQRLAEIRLRDTETMGTA